MLRYCTVKHIHFELPNRHAGLLYGLALGQIVLVLLYSLSLSHETFRARYRRDLSNDLLPQWLRVVKYQCGKTDVNRTWDVCPCTSRKLIGNVKINITKSMLLSPKDVTKLAQDGSVQPGGVWSPWECQASRSLLIIVPYRNRKKHLMALLAHLHPILQRQMVSYRILVVEQNQPPLFNKAALMNAGYKEAMKRGWNRGCVIMHDVDIYMEDDRCLLRCAPQIIHYATRLSRHNYTPCCDNFFGGVVSYSTHNFIKMNGYSNNFFGWGSEDTNAFKRASKCGIKHIYPPAEVSRLTTLKHGGDFNNPRYDRYHAQNFKKFEHYVNLNEGLSTIRYNVVKEKFHDLYTWLLVDISIKGLPYPRWHATQDYFSRGIGHCPDLKNDTLSTIQSQVAVEPCLDACAKHNRCETVLTKHAVQPGTFNCYLKSGNCKAVINSTSKTFYRGKDDGLGPYKYKYHAYMDICNGENLDSRKNIYLQHCAKLCDLMNTCQGFVCKGRNNKDLCHCELKAKCTPPAHGTYFKLATSFVKKEMGNGVNTTRTL